MLTLADFDTRIESGRRRAERNPRRPATLLPPGAFSDRPASEDDFRRLCAPGTSVWSRVLYERYACLRPLQRVGAWLGDHGLPVSSGTLADSVPRFVPLFEQDGRAVPVAGAEFSPSNFSLLGVQPLLGRPLIEADEASVPAVIS